MAGHVFLARGDLRHLHCDAFLAITDVEGHNSRSDWLDGHPNYNPSGPNLLGGISAGEVRRVLAPATECGAPAVYAGAIPELGSDDPDELAGLLAAFISASVRTEPELPMRLLAVPLIGTGGSGDGRINDVLVGRLLRDAHRLARLHDVDIAIVANGGEPTGERLFSAALHVRRHLAAKDPSWWEPLDSHDQEHAMQLAQLARDRQLVLFIGAGVSKSAELPDWNELMEGLAATAHLEEQLAEAVIDKRRDPLDRAEALAHAIGSNSNLGTLIADRIKQVSYPALQHVQLMVLPVTEIVTLNYDCLLEKASTDAGVPLVVIPKQPAGPTRWLLKLHGTIDEPVTLVLTRRDYLGYAAGRSALSGIVQALLITRHMLFVGFGMSDPHFHSILHEVRAALEQLQPPEDCDDARATGRLGTALIVDTDPLQTELWGTDVRSHLLAAADGHRHGRRLEIFLDFVLSEALPLSDHLLDPHLTGLLNNDDERLVAALNPLIDALASLPENPATGKLRKTLGQLGWVEPNGKNTDAADDLARQPNTR